MESPRFGLKERIAFDLKLGISLLAIGLYCFPQETRRKIRERQHYRCAETGVYDPHLSTHHKVPSALGGTDDAVNGVGLSREVHDVWDRRAFEEHIIYPGIPLSKAPRELFKNSYQFGKSRGLK